MKFDPKNHIIGKVYDLTQENMNAMISEIEILRKVVLCAARYTNAGPYTEERIDELNRFLRGVLDRRRKCV